MVSFRPAPAPAPITVYRYRGIASGWQPIGSRQTPEAAARLLSLAARINPDATLRIG